jgi:WD40 repeat protein
VALQRYEWEKACELAKSALSVLEQAEAAKKETGLYLLLWAKAQRNLSQQSEAVKNLEAAKDNTQPQDDVQLYLRILEELRTLYFEQGEYLKAFYLKLEQQEVKSKYGLQAFIGAGRLQPPQQIIDIGLESGLSKAEIVDEIVAASVRSQDVKRIIERIGTPACKLTIIHGQSGVGKSSIIQAGLVPALQLTTFEARDVLPVLLQSYHDWARDCGQCLSSGINKIKGVNLSTPIDTPTAILEQLRLNQKRNLLTVLIFDQFEEFFFAYQDLTSRREFYDFLAECLNEIGELKIILSLREDYLFYLLEWTRTTNLSMIDNDILNKKICYYLGNFSIADAKIVLQTLTKRSQLDLSEDLVNALVEDLAGEVREVRPIELQIAGMQLEKWQITQLSEYQQLGNQAKLKVVEQFLGEVIDDCGPENKDIAELVLYLLTDEKNTRPQKTLVQLAADLGPESKKLELVIEIVVKSGLVLEVPATPIERYQLVHDYLVPFIRKQRGAGLLELSQKLKHTEAEKQILAEARQEAERLLARAQKLTELERAASDALRLFELHNNQIEALISAVKTGKELKATVKDVRSLADYPIYTPQIALNQILDNIREQNRFKGHQRWVWSVRFSPDGKYIATASSDKTARLWDVTGKLIQEFKGHQDEVLSVRFSPDGKYIATASSDKTARLWDLTGKQIQEFKGHQDSVWSVSFSPDGKYIATASYDKTAGLWDLTGKLIQEFKGHQDSVESVSFSLDGKYIATASWDKTARLWDLTGNLIQEFKGHQDRVWIVSFSPDGKYIATTSSDKTARLWDVTGKLIQEFKGHQEEVLSVSFSGDGKYIATASRDKTARLWDLTGKLIQEFKGHQDSVESVSFSPDGKYIATASRDKTARLWDVTGKLIQQFKGYQVSIFSVCFNPDGKYIATASWDKTARLWDLTGKLIQEFKGHQDTVSSVSFSPDGKYIATASHDKTARLWDVTGKLIQEFKGHQEQVWSVRFSPDGKYIATVSHDKTARLWDLTGKLIQEFKGHQERVWSVSFSPDGKYIATASSDKTARLWDVTGKLIQEFKGHQDEVWSVRFSPDGKYIATASYDKTARLWDLTGKLIQEFKGHQNGVSSVSFSPDGKYIATASRDKTARLWDLTGKLIQEFKGHQDRVWSVSFSPDGKYIATASLDYTARLWQIRSLDEMLVQGCDWLHDYLQNNADESDKHLCDEISAQKK